MRGKGFRFGNVPPPVLILMGGGLLILVIVIVLVIKSVNSTDSLRLNMTTPLENAPKPTKSQQKLISQVAPPISRPPPSNSTPGQPQSPVPALTVGQLNGVISSISLDDGTKITTQNPTDMYPNIGPKKPGGCTFDSKNNMSLPGSGFMYNQISGTCVSCLNGGTLDTSTGVARCIICDDYTKYWDPSQLKCVSPPKDACRPGQSFNTSTSFGPIGCMEMSFAG